ncbi:precorrin-6y C5,15-methyltransferase (decarboxylating) subunit CbiE [Pedococcus sp. P5_B7]
MLKVQVVGIGADGWAGMGEPARNLVQTATVVLGGQRHLELLPDVPGQRRVPWPTPLREGLPGLVATLDGTVVALASGDPLLSGVGSTFVEVLGAEAVTVIPAVSSVALARAQMGWAAETTEVLRDAGTLVRHLAPGRRILLLSSDGSTPASVAEMLRHQGFGASQLTVLANLGADDESTHSTTAEEWAGEAPPLHVLAIECAGSTTLGLLAGLPDEAFEHDGQLTKRDLRASALARLAPQPGQLLWDVGAGAGSVAIEWLRAHRTCQALAVERSAERAERIARNSVSLGVPSLRVVVGSAPEALAGLPTPDAVFVGGGATTPGLLEACWSSLAPGGRLVIHGVTMETEALLGQWYAGRRGELVRLSVEHASPLGDFTGWTPARTVTQWAGRKS